MPTYNGTSILWHLDVQEVDFKFASDVCLKGARGKTQTHFYRSRFPATIEVFAGNNIAVLEMMAIIVGCKLWGKSGQDSD